MELWAGSGSALTNPSPPSFSSVFSFASLHSRVVNAQNSVLKSKVLEWLKSKNRKVKRIAHCETESTSAYCVTFSNGRKFGRGEQQLQQNVSHVVTVKDRTHNRGHAHTESRNSRCGRINISANRRCDGSALDCVIIAYVRLSFPSPNIREQYSLSLSATEFGSNKEEEDKKLHVLQQLRNKVAESEFRRVAVTKIRRSSPDSSSDKKRRTTWSIVH
jgi:hypothetical protein